MFQVTFMVIIICQVALQSPISAPGALWQQEEALSSSDAAEIDDASESASGDEPEPESERQIKDDASEVEDQDCLGEEMPKRKQQRAAPSLKLDG